MKKFIFLLGCFIVISAPFIGKHQMDTADAGRSYTTDRSLERSKSGIIDNSDSLYVQDIAGKNMTKIKLRTRYLESLKALDVDDDRADELIVLTNQDGHPQNGQLNIYKAKGKMFRRFWRSKKIDGYPYGMKIKDVDLDGMKDILVAWNGLQYYRNLGDRFTPEGQLLAGTPAGDLFSADDLDDDVLFDLALGGPGVDSGYTKVFQQAVNTHQHTTYGAVPRFVFKRELRGTKGSNMVTSLNLNNDGKLDLLVGELYSGDVNVFKNKGNFRFKKQFSRQFNTRIFSIESADFDGDGLDDFIVAEAWEEIHFFKNYRGRRFKRTFKGTNIGSCFETLAYDLNQDSLVDLVAAAFDGKVYLYENRDDFKFQEKTCTVRATENFGLTLGDFNGDGLIDIAFGMDPVIVVWDAMNSFK